jgi:hypothetical protein
MNGRFSHFGEKGDKKMKVIAIVAGIVLLAGCATAPRMNRLSLGLSKAEVIRIMGTPSSTAAQGRTEYLNYKLTDSSKEAFYGIETPYFIRLVDGRVDAYGRRGDFDSTKNDAVDLNLNPQNNKGP